MRPVSFIRTRPQERGATEAESYQQPLSLDDTFVRHPTATFFVRVGELVTPEEQYDVRHNDVLVVDRAL
jgi:hypothetical protein